MSLRFSGRCSNNQNFFSLTLTAVQIRSLAASTGW